MASTSPSVRVVSVPMAMGSVFGPLLLLCKKKIMEARRMAVTTISEMVFLERGMHVC